MTGKRLKISDIFSIGSHHPPEVPPRTSPISAELDNEISAIFTNDYLSGLDQMLETKWFSTNDNALNRIFADRALHEEAAFFAETVKYRSPTMDMSGVFSQEARLIWHMLGTCKHSYPVANGTNGTSPANAENEDSSLKEARARFDILEALLTNQTLEANPLRQIFYPTDIAEEKKGEVDFWEALGNFVASPESDMGSNPTTEHALSAMRNVLQAQEVRDAIYSMAIARHLGNRVRGFPNQLPPSMNQNPEDDHNKLGVAMGFISHECRSGTQQVIARICDMAMLSWTASRTP